MKRKKWLYFFIVFVLIVAVLYVWRYNQSQVFKNRVPATATKVINVNLRQIENHLLFDFLTNPITYLKPRKKKDSIKKTRISLIKAVSIPKNVLFYTNSNDLRNIWFSSIFEVNDVAELSDYFLKENFKESEIDDVFFFTKANFVLAIKNKKLIIALKANKKADVNLLLISLFDNNNFMVEDAEQLKPLLNNKNDISFSFIDDILEANFKDGVFKLQGTLSSDLFIANANHPLEGNEVVAISGKVNMKNTVFKNFLTDKKDKFNKVTHLSLDSIVDKWNGKFNLIISSIEQKTDTIVSYEYDDDFNKVEIKTTQERKIPTLNLNLGQADTSSLSDYFYSKNAIQVIENDTIFTTIPIFKFLATDIKDCLELSVNQKENQSKTSSSTSKSKLNFYFNSEKYLDKALDIPLSKNQEKFLKMVKTMNLEWTEDNQFTFKINLKDSRRNFLGQLIKQ